MKKKTFAPEIWRYLIDSSSLINIQENAGVRLLEKRKGAILISRTIAKEVAYDKRIRRSDPVRQFVIRNPEVITDFKDDEEKEYLKILCQSGIDPGEASVMAISLKRGLPLVTDDKKATRKANNHGINTLSWQEFLRGDQRHV
ncbi:PIN domain-containing protein [Dehalococcoidia bacterium]|nr:PIN domain-containing protein [candidate division NPL-UPA2 bacterium]MCL0058287.1 PIN domain-containing protein [Dehalococcoidia bacterium]MCL0069371.1 PIN domain-containing protein [Dehalococcoidia bacterium]